MRIDTRTRAVLRDIAKPPEPRQYLGPVDGEAMAARAMKLYPEPNEDGELVLASRWLEAVRWLRSRKRWILDESKEIPRT